jgi:hypothetical protein
MPEMIKKEDVEEKEAVEKAVEQTEFSPAVETIIIEMNKPDMPVAMANQICTAKAQNGFKLINTHFVGMTSEGAFGMIYVFARQ